MPVSATRKPSTTAPASSASFSTCTTTSPWSVNLIALPTRLTSTWRSRGASPTRRSGTSGAMRPASSRPFWWARRPSVRRVSPRASRRSNSVGRSSKPPRLDLREVEDVVDEPEQRFRRVLEGDHVLALPRAAGRCRGAARPSRSPRSSGCGSRGSCWRGSRPWPGSPRRPPPAPAAAPPRRASARSRRAPSRRRAPPRGAASTSRPASGRSRPCTGSGSRRGRSRCPRPDAPASVVVAPRSSGWTNST